MTNWVSIPKLEGSIMQLQIEQHGPEAALVFAVKSKQKENNKDHNIAYFVTPFHGDPVVSAQFDLLRDAFNNNKIVRIAYEKTDDTPTLRMLAVRIQFE